jgi:hypothetical protein
MIEIDDVGVFLLVQGRRRTLEKHTNNLQTLAALQLQPIPARWLEVAIMG